MNTNVKEKNTMTTSSTANLRLATTADTNTGIGTIAINVTVEFDELAVGLQIQRGDDTVRLQLHDDTAHRLGIALIEAAREITVYAYGDEEELFADAHVAP